MADLEFTLNDRGESVDRWGRIFAALPGEVVRCDAGSFIIRVPSGKAPIEAPATATRVHPTDCKCGGTGTIAIRRPKSIPVDSEDDGLTAMFVALGEAQSRRDGDMGGVIIDERFLQPEITREHGGGSGGSRRSKPQPKKSTGEPHPQTAEDGREEPWLEAKTNRNRAKQTLETRRGRPTRFEQPLTNVISVTVAPEMMARLTASGLDLEEVAHAIEVDPAWVEIVAEQAL